VGFYELLSVLGLDIQGLINVPIFHITNRICLDGCPTKNTGKRIQKEGFHGILI
jgi:hypothetical protein